MTKPPSLRRVALFFLGCVGSRLLLAYVACKNTSHTVSTALAVAAICVSGVWLLMSMGLIVRNNGAETFGSGIWWQSFRKIHAFFYLAFALQTLVSGKSSNSCYWLYADVILAVLLYVYNYYYKSRPTMIV